MSADPSQDLVMLATQVVDHARSGEQVEAYAVHAADNEVRVRGGEVESLSASQTRGVGVRVIVDGRQGYASTALVTEAGLAEALEEARSNAAVATADDANGLPDQDGEPPELDGLVSDDLAALTHDRRIEMALALEETVRAADARVTGVETCLYADSVNHLALVSTAGVTRTQSRTDAYAYAIALATEGDQSQSGLGLTVARGPSALDIDGAGLEAATKAVRLLGAGKPRSRRTRVVFDPWVTAQFLGVLGAALSAEAALKGRSLFAGRIGEQVASDGVRLLDDGLYPGGPATAPWDAEGVPQQATALIEGGVLGTFLHNTWTARRTGDGARSTGNASRAGFSSSPGLAPTNFYFAPGDASRADLLAAVDDGVYVQDVMGLHSGANPISGEFSVSFQGLTIRDGELAEPIREAAVSSTIVDVLRNITAVGSDLRFFPFGGSPGGATLVIDEMSVSGD